MNRGREVRGVCVLACVPCALGIVVCCGKFDFTHKNKSYSSVVCGKLEFTHNTNHTLQLFVVNSNSIQKNEVYEQAWLIG